MKTPNNERIGHLNILKPTRMAYQVRTVCT